MSRNVEIKAVVRDFAALVRRSEAIASEGPVKIRQDDTFFRCDTGRLKLREFGDGSGELIYYRRADAAGPKASFYLRSRTSDPDTLRTSLRLAYGQVGRVRKVRILFIAGRTRIHLDRVEGLGEYLELEVVLDASESTESGVVEAHRLMDELGIVRADLVEGAYVDLLAGAACRTNMPNENEGVRTTERTGRCLCGQVRYRITSEPVVARLCWCRDCQHIAGNGTANVMFASDAIAVTGALAEFSSKGDSGNTVSRRFCPTCGSHLFADSTGRAGLTVVRVGTLDEPSSVAPVANIWSASAPRWACLDPALERVERQPAPPRPSTV